MCTGLTFTTGTLTIDGIHPLRAIPNGKPKQDNSTAVCVENPEWTEGVRTPEEPAGHDSDSIIGETAGAQTLFLFFTVILPEARLKPLSLIVPNQTT